MVDQPDESYLGWVEAVRSSVIDVRFDVRLPEINSRLIAYPGDEREVVIEVLDHVTEEVVRGIA